MLHIYVDVNLAKIILVVFLLRIGVFFIFLLKHGKSSGNGMYNNSDCTSRPTLHTVLICPQWRYHRNAVEEEVERVLKAGSI